MNPHLNPFPRLWMRLEPAWLACAAGWLCGLGLALGLAVAAQAQPAAVPAGDVPTPTGVAAVSAPTVLGKPVDERAVRQAARPFRWILDADPAARRSGERPGERPAERNAERSAERPAERATSERPASAANSQRQAGSAAARPAVPQAPARPETTLASAPPASSDGSPALDLPPPESPPGSAPGPSAADAGPAPRANAAPLAAAPSPSAAPTASAAAPRPQIKTLVEPDVPEAVLRKRPRGPSGADGNHRVLLDIDIGTDGQVRAARVRETTNPALEEPVREAVLKWLYQPLPQAMTETVQLQIEGR